MSRIGNRVIEIPQGVKVEVGETNVITVKGPKGELTQKIDSDLTVKIEDGQLTLDRPTDQKRHRQMHGLYNALLGNMVEGVANGFTRELELIGVGYRVSNRGQLLEIAVGYSHPIYFYVPDEVEVETKTEKGSNPLIILRSSDKQLLGQVASKIRAFRKPEPFKGKGIRYKGEYVRKKAGKTAKS